MPDVSLTDDVARHIALLVRGIQSHPTWTPENHRNHAAALEVFEKFLPPVEKPNNG